MKRKGADYHHGDLRRALVEATLRLVAEHGTDGFTLRAAAKLAGVSDGAPYHHFADKQALLAAVAEESFALLLTEMRSAQDAHSGDSRHKAQAASVAYVSFAIRNPSRFRIMSSALGQCRSKQSALYLAARRTYGFVRESLALAVSKEDTRASSVTYAWALVHGLSALAVDGHLGAARAPTKVEELARRALESFDPGDRREPESMPRSGGRSRTRGPWSSRRNVS